MRRTMQLIYSNCSSRVKQKRKEENKRLEDVYSVDKSLISRIENNRRTKKNNPYLVPDRVFEYYVQKPNGESKAEGLICSLSFKDRQEVLWGTIEERKKSIKSFYNAIILDMLDESDLIKLTNRFLCDYTEYAYYYTYYDILFGTDNHYPALFYGVSEDDILCNYDAAQNDASDFLFLRCGADFEDVLLSFMNKTTSFDKINEIVSKELIHDKIIPLMKQYIAKEDSLGSRTITLIKGDLIHVAKIIDKQQSSAVQKKLIHATSDYLYKICEIQKQQYGFVGILDKKR